VRLFFVFRLSAPSGVYIAKQYRDVHAIALGYAALAPTQRRPGWPKPSTDAALSLGSSVEVAKLDLKEYKNVLACWLP